MAKITVEGLSEIEHAMENLSIQVNRRVLRDGLRAGAEVYRNGMSARAPERTGLLRSSITVRVKIGARGQVASIGPSKDAFYGRFLELGTRKMEPRPFMRPTLIADGRAAVEAFLAAGRATFERLKLK